jgi:hypothetical protein
MEMEKKNEGSTEEKVSERKIEKRGRVEDKEKNKCYYVVPFVLSSYFYY